MKRVKLKLVGVSLAELSSALKYSGLYVEQGEGNNSDYAEIKAIPAFLLKEQPRHEGRALESLEVWEKLGEASGVSDVGVEPQSSEEGK